MSPNTTPEMMSTTAPEMTPEKWRRIKHIFDQAVECETGRREEFIVEACAGDDELRAEVEALIEGHKQAGGFIEQPVAAEAARLLDESLADPLVDKQIGPYKIQREIGRGGMGQVYLAVRDDEYKKRVALKVVKRGMDTQEIVRRFRYERQILAGLDHPNIAKLLDGGTTEDGLPYFAMEYVEGKLITAYCDERKLPTAERLKLFRQVCDAVQYAHQNLVIHRDIKPSNILITEDGAPKLLDFGIAKLLDPEGVGLTIDPTVTGALLMTPEYASPEQARAGTITTASDVYSLGVVLYELLTGHRPQRFKQRSLEEMIRVICDEEPLKPSAAISRIEENDTGGTSVRLTPESVSRTRDGQPEKLRRRLRGDLDNIVLMAMSKEPQRRYGSAEQLSEDIRRHLDGLPVIARKDTLLYRGAKFIKRRKAGVAAAALLLLTLIAGIAATTRQARIAERRFNEVRHLANTFLFKFDESIEKLPGSTPARRLIVSTALEYLDRLAREASGDAALQSELAAAYVKVGDLQGNPYFPNVGDFAGAEQSYRKALAIREALARRAGDDLATRRDLAVCHDRIADILTNKDELAEAEKLYRQVIEIREAWLAAGRNDKDSRADLAKAYDKFGQTWFWLGDATRARDYYQKALKLREALAAEFPQDYTFSRALCISHVNIGDTYIQQDNYAAGIASYERAREIAECGVNADATNALAQRDLGTSHSKLGEALAWANKPEESLAHHREALAVRQRLASSDPTNRQAQRDLAISHTFLGVLLASNKKLAEGQEQVRQSVTIFEELRRTDPTNKLTNDDLMIAYTRQGRLLMDTDAEAGLESLRKALALAEDRVAKDQNDTSPRRGLAGVTQQLAENYARLAANKKASVKEQIERWQQALEYFQRHLQIALDLKQRGALSESEVASIEKAHGQIAECEAKLAKLR